MIVQILIFIVILITLAVVLFLIYPKQYREYEKQSIPIQKARERITLNYLPQQIKIQPNWYENEVTIKDCFNYYEDALRYSLIHQTNIIIEFEKLLVNFHKIPYSINKKYRIIQACVLCGYYLLNSSIKLNLLAADFIISTCFGYNKPSIYLIGPMFMAAYQNDTLQIYLDTGMYTQSREFYINANLDYNGVYLDNGVDMRTLLELLSPRVLYAYELDQELFNPDFLIQKLQSVMFHPTIPRGIPGLFLKQTNFEVPTYMNTTRGPDYGIRVIPSIGFIRYFTQNYKFSARAVRKTIPYYKPNNMNLGQWITYRNVHTIYTNKYQSFPELGDIIIHNAKTIYDANATYKDPYAKSAVFCYRNHGLLYQNYKISGECSYMVTELIHINSTTNKIKNHINIKNTSDKFELEYFTSIGTFKFNNRKITPIVIGLNGSLSIVSEYDLTTGYVHSEKTKEELDLPLTIKNITIKQKESHIILLEDGIPKCLFSENYKDPELLELDDVRYQFEYDFESRQMLVLK